jgi:outer membrane lipoprotein-sorting protein
MKSNTIVYILIALVVIGGIAYMMTKGDNGDARIETEVTSNDIENMVADSRTQTASMKELVDKGEPVKCTFTQVTSNADSNGTVYIADGKVRGDFETTSAGQNFNSYMISDGSDIYVWSSLTTQGFKMPVSNTPSAGAESQNGVSYDQKLNYDCDPWNKDVSVFVLPANISFGALPTY